MTPALARSSRTAKASTGVGSARGRRVASTPAPAMIAAVSRAKTAELRRPSEPRGAELEPPREACGEVIRRLPVAGLGARDERLELGARDRVGILRDPGARLVEEPRFRACRRDHALERRDDASEEVGDDGLG